MPLSFGRPVKIESDSTHIEDHSSRTVADREIDSSEQPPDGGYGWVCVACCFAVNCFSWGVVSSYGIFLSYYLSNMIFPGSQPLDFALIGGLNFGTAMLASPVVTICSRTWGLRIPMYAGSLFLGGGFITASFATHTWHLYLSQGALVGLGVGFVYIPTIPVISQWFLKKRSLANGITAAGSGIGGLIFSFAAGAMIDNIGHQWALRILGIIVFLANVLSTSFIRDRHAIVRSIQRAFDFTLLARWDVIFLLTWAFISMLGYITLLYSLSDFARSIGLSSQQGTQIVALLNLGTALGRPFIGVASDRYGRSEVASGLTLFCGLSCVAIWIPATDFGVTVLFGIISGAILGVFWVTIGPLCAEVVGLRRQPSLLSLAWLSVVLPTTFSEVIALYLRRSGSARPYLYVQIFCALCYIIASVCLWVVRIICKKAGRQLDSQSRNINVDRSN